ncbi:unnamed protein product, partial [Sphagnum tenellum]
FIMSLRLRDSTIPAEVNIKEETLKETLLRRLADVLDIAKGVVFLSSTYSMAKSALDMMTRCLALELGPLGIRVNTV